MPISRPVLTKRLAIAFLAAGVAGCGSGHRASSTSSALRPTKTYLDCEKAANVARSLLARAYGSAVTGNVDELIASYSERAAAALRQGERQIGSLAAGSANTQDQRLMSELKATVRSLTVLARQAARNHQKMPTVVLRRFAMTRTQLDTICPPT